MLKSCKEKLLVELEQSAEVRRLATAKRQTPDFEAWETLLLQAARQGGAGVLGSLLTPWQDHARREIVRCACGQRRTSQGRRGKGLVTTLGAVAFRRSFYPCEQCRRSRFPDDERLDIVNTTYSPGVRRLMARAGSQTQFGQAAEDLLCYAGLKVEAREIERVAEDVGRQVEQWLSEEQNLVVSARPSLPPQLEPGAKFYISFDGTGIPVRKSELLGRKGKQADGSARTREVKLGCVFTQVGLDKEGHPQRDPDSTTYVGAIESSTLFGWRMYAEALRRGLEQAQTVIVLTDGQGYNRSITQTHFPGAVHIVDLFPAYEHLTLITQILWGPEAESPKAWRDLLEAGDSGRLVSKAGKNLPRSPKPKKALSKELGYFENNAACMGYADYREKGLLRGIRGCRGRLSHRHRRASEAIRDALVGPRS